MRSHVQQRSGRIVKTYTVPPEVGRWVGDVIADYTCYLGGFGVLVPPTVVSHAGSRMTIEQPFVHGRPLVATEWAEVIDALPAGLLSFGLDLAPANCFVARGTVVLVDVYPLIAADAPELAVQQLGYGWPEASRRFLDPCNITICLLNRLARFDFRCFQDCLRILDRFDESRLEAACRRDLDRLAVAMVAPANVYSDYYALSKDERS